MVRIIDLTCIHHPSPNHDAIGGIDAITDVANANDGNSIFVNRYNLCTNVPKSNHVLHEYVVQNCDVNTWH
jgi:hypothetical protein